MVRIGVLAAVVVVLVGAWLLLGRPAVEARSTSDPDITVECDGSTSVTQEACGAWGDEVLALGAPSTTFEMIDVNRLRFTKPLLGFGSPCQVEYFLQRYPDDPAWDTDIPCEGD